MKAEALRREPWYRCEQVGCGKTLRHLRRRASRCPFKPIGGFGTAGKVDRRDRASEQWKAIGEANYRFLRRQLEFQSDDRGAERRHNRMGTEARDSFGQESFTATRKDGTTVVYKRLVAC